MKLKSTFANRTDKPRADKYAKQREWREKRKDVKLHWMPRIHNVLSDTSRIVRSCSMCIDKPCSCGANDKN